MDRRQWPHSDPDNFLAVHNQCLQALCEKDRLSHVGRLVLGLIHNFNGPLQNITMLAEMLSKGLQRMTEAMHTAPGNVVQSWSEFNAKQQDRLESLTQQITILSEMQRDLILVQEMEQMNSGLDINALLNALVRIFSADLFFKHKVDLTLRVSENLPLLEIRGADLVPALMHLFENALLALREVARKSLTIESVKEDDFIQLVFRDTGLGFVAEPECLFHPFYSGWTDDSFKDAPEERHAGFGLFFVRHQLESYGVRTYLKREGEETLAVVEIPLPE